MTQGLAGHVLMAVENHLHRKRGMRTDLERHVPPVRILKMKSKMIDPHGRTLPLQVRRTARRGLHSPHRVRGAMNRDTKQPFLVRIARPMLFGDFVHVFIGHLFQDRDLPLLGHGPHPPRKPSCPTHHVGLVQVVIAAIHVPPPSAETAGRAEQGAVSIEHDPVHTIVAAIQQVLITNAERIRGGHEELLKRAHQRARDNGHGLRSQGGKERGPRSVSLPGARCTLGAPSTRISLVRLRPRRA